MSNHALEIPAVPSDFGFTEEHELARAEARRFLEARSPMTDVRRLATDASGFDAALYRDVAALGWLGLTTPEVVGGLGLDALHQALLLEEMGRVLLPSPYFASLLALWTVGRGGSSEQAAALIPSILSGERIATVALSEPGASWEPGDVAATAEPSGAGYVLRGVKSHVLFGAAASVVIVPCKEPDGSVGLFVVDLPDAAVAVEPEITLDGTRRLARLTLGGVHVARTARLERDGTATLAATGLFASAMLASEMVGGIERTLALTRDYAATRMQFGRPIGAFQAVKHPIVDMMLACEAARSLAFGAAVAFDRDPRSAEVLARGAKAFASDAYLAAAKKGVQLHGGFGFTWDCDVHFYFKRAMWSRSTLGDGTFHRRHLARMLLDET